MRKIIKTTLDGIHQVICILALIFICVGFGSSIFVIMLLQKFTDSYYPNDKEN